MRISDWSSDVCSSDLTRGAHVDLAVDETLLVTVREPLCSDDTVARSFQMIDRPLRRIFAVGLFAREKQAGVAEAPDFPDEAARFGFGAIGRASCRERVCRCGGISEVAVSLKEKEQKR